MSVSDWSLRTYGSPCRECGFVWTIGIDEAKAVIASVPSRYSVALTGAVGNERHPDLSWSVSAYVSHVGDNLRIWAERIAGIALGGSNTVPGYDENMLAAARTYEALGLRASLWSLEHSVRDWLEAVEMAPSDLTMVHPERGTIDLAEVARSNAHDALHHEWDIARTLAR